MSHSLLFPTASDDGLPPRLVLTDGDSNVVAYQGWYYRIPHGAGPLDLSQCDARGLAGVSASQSLEEVCPRAAEILGRQGEAEDPSYSNPLLADDFGGFNIVQWRGRFYGVPKSTGAFDFATQDVGQLRDVETGESVEQVRSAILAKYRGPVPHAWGFEGFLDTTTPLEELGLPEIVEIEPIHYCNMACIMCHVPYVEMTKRRLDVDRTLRHLECLKGKWAMLGDAYEPVLHPQFAQLAQGLSDIGVKMDLTTNGSLFTAKLVDQLRDCNFRIVTLSFDGGTAETYEKIRAGANFERTVERIRRFRQAMPEQVYFNVNQTLMKSNIDELLASIDLWESSGFDHMGLILMRVREDVEAIWQESLHPIMAYARQRIMEAAAHVIDNNYRMILSSPVFHECGVDRRFPDNMTGSIVHSEHPLYRRPVNPREYFQNGPYPGMSVGCRSPFKFARIEYSGDVILCQRFIVGNIHDQPFEEIWFGDKANRVRRSVMTKPNICRSCEHYRFCIRAGDMKLDEVSDFVAYHDGSKQFTAPTVVGHLGVFNVVRWLDGYYAVPKDVTLEDFMVGSLHPEDPSLQGGSVEEVYAQIHENMLERGLDWLMDLGEAVDVVEPVDDYRGYTVVRWGSRYFILKQSEGHFDFYRHDPRRRSGFAEVDSLDSARREIDRREGGPVPGGVIHGMKPMKRQG